MFSRKGQGTIEYLVIIAIVVVIALVVVGLMLQVLNQGSGIPETTAKTAWKSAEPFGLIDWSYASGSSGLLTIVLKNNSSETLAFIDMNIASSTSNTDSNYSTQSNIAPGATFTRTIDPSSNCTSGSRYSFPKSGIVIDYNTVNIAGKRQVGVADIVGSCS